jgi:tetratricopeptide (TPR) repeat protein
LKGFRQHPLAGSGAGTFRFTNYLYRPNASFIVKHAHNQWINVLSELGLVGLVLFALAIGGLVFAALRPVGRAARDLDRGLLAALQAAIVAFVFHMTIDWDWDMAAATVAFLLLTGVCAAFVCHQRVAARAGIGLSASDAAQAAPDDRPAAPDDVTQAAPDDQPAAPPVASREPRRLRFGIASRVLATGVLLLVALSWLAPYLSDRALSRSIVLASDNHTAAAVAQARRAHRLDPLAVDPLFTLALVEQQQGRGSAAQATLEQAVRLQPQNYATYYELGLMQLNVLGLRHQAAASFRRALSLNPYDDNSSYELSVASAPAAMP